MKNMQKKIKSTINLFEEKQRLKERLNYYKKHYLIILYIPTNY